MNLSGVRKMLIGLPLLALLAVVALPSARVEAASADTDATVEATVDASLDDVAMFASNCTYYNNAQHTQVVGQFGYDCCNNPVSWGRKTQFKVCGGCFICYPPPQ